MDLISSACCSNLYLQHCLQMQFQPPSQLLHHHSPYFPSLQMQFQPPPPLPLPQLQIQQHSSSSSSCLIGGMNEEEDEKLLNLAASATSGFNFEDNMLLDYSTYEQSNYNCFPECYCHLPFNQKLPFHGGDLDSFIHFPDQPLQTLNSPPFHSLETSPKTLTADEPVRKSALSVVNNDSDRKRVTAQSLAARERRRKITRKTQELGQLVPGGNKMNTAEMLQSAFKYIQFLQSQLQLLQLMGNEEKKTAPVLHLVASPVIQEKLYMEGCCIIPRAFAKTLLQNSNDSSINEELRGIID